jgi:hypothetical protein
MFYIKAEVTFHQFRKGITLVYLDILIYVIEYLRLFCVQYRIGISFCTSPHLPIIVM